MSGLFLNIQVHDVLANLNEPIAVLLCSEFCRSWHLFQSRLQQVYCGLWKRAVVNIFPRNLYSATCDNAETFRRLESHIKIVLTVSVYILVIVIT